MRDLLNSINRPDVVKGIYRGRKAAMETEDLEKIWVSSTLTHGPSFEKGFICAHLIVNESSQWQVVEKVGKVLPDIGVAILSQALVVESIYLCNLSTFVISAKNGDPIAVPNFQSYEKGDSFNRIIPSIDVIAHEEIVGIWRISTDSKELRKIVLVIETVRERSVSRCCLHERAMCTVNIRIDHEYHHTLSLGIAPAAHWTRPTKFHEPTAREG